MACTVWTLHVRTCVALVVAAMFITTGRNVLLNIVIDWNLPLLPHLLLLKDLLLLVTTIFSLWTFQISLISQLLLTNALVRAFLGRCMVQNWWCFVLITSKLGVNTYSSYRFLILILNIR
jgi:hypothetical protein